MTVTPPAGIQDAARHLAEERASEAVVVLERLIDESPAYVTAHVLLAKAYEAHGRLADAVDAWHRAYFLMPGSPLVLRERARLLRDDPPPATPPTTRSAGSPSAGSPSAGSPSAESPVVEAEAPSSLEAPDADEASDGGDQDRSLIDEVDDLDGLIEKLENAPRIRPDSNFDDDFDAFGEAEEEDEVVSETLARIYESQGEHEAAARAYEQLAELNPERADDMRTKAAELRRLTAGTKR